MKLHRLIFSAIILLSQVASQGQTTLTTVQLSAGQKFGLTLRSDGSVWAWGTNQVGEVGLGTNTLVLWPTRIASVTNAVSISAGSLHSLAVQNNGSVWAWGLNSDGRLGSGNFNTASNPVAVTRITNAIAVSAGGSHSLALLANGGVMAWGANNGGQLGTGNTVSTNQPVAAGNFTNAIAVSAGTNFSLALCQDGSVWAWGTNNLGQLGLGSTATQLNPTKITVLSNIVQIVAGASHSLALDRNGVVYAWGRNTEGQIGNGTTVNATAPVVVPSFGATTNLGTVKFVEAGYNSSAVILKSGRLFYWGWYGNGTAWSSNQPPQELNASSGQVFTSVAYGDSYLLAGNQDGSTWAWGFNQYAQRGNGSYYATGDNWSYQVGNAEFSFSPNPYPVMTRFNRGDRNNMNYAPMLPYSSFVLPLDLEEGVRLNHTGNDAYGYGSGQPWFFNVQKTTRQHAWQITTSTNLSRFNVDNPIVAFGQSAGGSPLYLNQPYRFGLFGGAYNENLSQTNIIRILVYSRSALASGATNVAPTNTIYISLPRRDIAADATAWSNYVTNGNRVVVSTNDLMTSVEFNNGQNNYASDILTAWNLGWSYAIPTKVTIDGLRLTHMAASTNYCYIVEALGQCEVGANVFAPMAVTNSTGWAYLPMYALGFDTFPAWRAHFLDNPNFAGTPVPPAYASRSPLELGGLTATITNNIWITNNAAYTNLDNSPELRRSLVLDQLVSDMRNDPLALANYVINNINLTDPIAYGERANTVGRTIELGGVNRSALATYLEGQGSPVEQCALLVYLLRQAGYPASYVWPTNNNLQLLDTTVSRLWQINVHGIISLAGLPVITNSLIIVNYPWVVANIGTNSYQIFPWLKNTAVTKGLNIYDYLPTNYPNAYAWVKDFALANPSLMALASPNDGVATFLQNYLTSVINTNSLQPNLSLQNFGLWSASRPQNSTSWSQLPQPDALNNQSQVAVIQTLSDSPTTYPFLTNIFDQVRIEIFKGDTNSANRLIDSGLWRTCDLHNRKLLLYTNVPNSVSLWLSGYRAGITNTGNFTNYLTSTNALLVQVAKGTITSAVTNLPVRITYQKRIGTLSDPNIWYPSQGYYGGTFAPFNCGVRDVSAIIPSVASVSPAMLNVWAQDYWNLEQKRAVNTNFVPAVTDEAGDAAMIMGSTFFQKLWSDNQLNQNLHQVRGLSWDSWGVAALTQLSNNKMQVKLNMNWFATFLIGNGMANQDSGDRGRQSLNNYMTMLQALGSSAEYSTIASVWPDQSPVSSLRLIQIAAQNWRTNGTAMPPELNVVNYTTLGNQAYTGYGATLLKNQVPSIWSQVTNVFATFSGSNYTRILITPGQVTNSTGSFKGMASLVFDNETQTGAQISDNQTTLNGGFGLEDFWVSTYDFSPTYGLTYTLDYSPTYGSYSFFPTSISVSTPLPQYNFTAYDALNLTASSGLPQQIAFTPQQNTQAAIIAAGLNLPNSSTANAIKSESDAGWFGNAWARVKQAASMVADPVQIVSGDFCADSVDITLAGPMPLALHRNYQSRNLATDQIGAGWKLGVMPWLVIVTNSAGNVIATAAEMDGSVLAYRQQTNGLWTVTPADNPDLVNFSPNGIGGIANVFNNRLQQNPTNSQIYTLFGSDGSQRVFQVMTNFGINSGTNYLNRIRPYLTLWQDHAGNYCQFTYGTNSANNNFGQLYRIQGANGASLTFQYDYYGRTTQVLSDDNRAVAYQYDNYGDLVGVTLPDNTAWQYGYQHYTFTTNSQTYTDSTHLLTSETKPDGRQLANTYDNLRRVVAQAATVGINRELITNATFFYTNNCTGLTNSLISGVTVVKDVFGNPYYYYYTNNLLTQIIEPLGRTNIQSWYSLTQSNSPGYYPNSLQFTVDPRGLTNWFLYDSNGNITNQTVSGDLTGSGIAADRATNVFTYTTNNVVSTAADASGNTQTFVYDSTDGFQLNSLQLSSGGVGVFTNRWFYSNVTSTVAIGSVLQTNRSFGLCVSSVKADAATNSVVYNGRGFPTQVIRYAATADNPANTDPAVVTYLTFSPRGDLISAVDASGRQVAMSFDAMGRMEWRDVFDQNGSVLSQENFYYDGNGALQWYDGPRANPDDTVYFDYDGAGRMVQQVRWRTQAKADGSGVQAIPGDNLYAPTFNTFDYFGNLTSTADARGAYTTNRWDALGRLVQRRAFDVGGGAQLSADGFAYEVGGLVQNYTNALGGVTTTLYTSTGQPRFRQNADGSTNGWKYYLDGRIKQEFQGNGAYWLATYNDSLRKATKIFYSAVGQPLATNIYVFDPRGNQSQFTDAGNNTFTHVFDGLNRLKSASGPAITTISQGGSVPNSGIWVTNVLQQTSVNFFDASGSAVTNVNALGEKSVVTKDILGRTTGALVYSSSGSIVRERYFAYAADNNSVTITDGSGSTAVSRTVYTDADNNPVLSVSYPSAYATEFTLNQFDVSGNLVSAQRNSTLNGNVTAWTTASYAFDGLNRLTGKLDRDNAVSTYAYDSSGNLTNCVLPGNLQWQAGFNNAGQILSENFSAGASLMRSTTYGYYSSGSPFAGLLQSKTDGRGTTSAFAYDNWLRLTNQTCTGSLPEQNISAAWNYEPRGLLTGFTQQFASTNTGPSTAVVRAFDPYGQLASESVSVGASGYGAYQSWDAAGRRSQLNIGTAAYGYSWQADGNLIGASDPTGSGVYAFNTAGLLTGRTVGNRATSITSRDGTGRPLAINTSVNLVSQLAETLSWTGDGLLAAHTLQRGDFTDNRSYSYANLSRRLTREQLNLNGSTTWTNNFTYDNGIAAGPGVLTSVGKLGQGSALWAGVTDAFSRIATGTNAASTFPASGRVNGQSVQLNAWLDNQPVSISAVGTNAMQWRAMMELTPGAHQLKVSALHPSQYFTAWATNTFTNNIAYQTTVDGYDSQGFVTNRIWKNPSGAVQRTQTLTWDAFGRLLAVADRDTNNSGYNWSAVYDAFNRRLQTTTVLVSNGVAATPSSPNNINQYYDPLAEFLELGVSTTNQSVWKLYGGGELAGTSPYLNQFSPTICDARGNVLGEITNGIVSWNPSRPTGYGAVPGYRPAAFGSGVDVAQASAWHGCEVDITGYYQRGHRTYDPVAGRWLSFDPMWNDGDPNGFTYCGGDPINFDDPDGLISKQYGQFQYNGGFAGYGLRGMAGLYNQFGNSSSSTLMSLGAYNNASLLNMAAGAVSPSSYVNGFNSLQTRAENVIAGEYVRGSGNTWAAAQGLSSVVGDVVGYNGVYEGGFGVDRQGETMLGGADRWSRGLMGGSQMILTGVGLKGVYNPDASFLGGQNPAAQFVFDARTGRYRDVANGQFVAARNLPWPGNNGFISSKPGVLTSGTIIDRYGNLSGRYAGSPGVTISQRGLAAGSQNMPYTQLQALKPLPAQIGPAAPVPAFGAVGGSTQYLFDYSISELISQGYLKPL